MAAYSEKVQQIYLFDRDSTLLSAHAKSASLINPVTMSMILRAIVNNENAVWGIVSSGSTTVEADKSLQLLQQQGLDYSSNLPAYPQMLRSFLGTTNLIDVDAEGKKSLTGLVGEENQELVLAALRQGEYNAESKKLTLVNERAGINVAITVSEEAVMQIKCGRTVIDINIHQWLMSHELLQKGDNKIIQALIAMDQKECFVEPTEGMKSLGISKITPPDDYSLLQAEDVIMTDDKEGVVALMERAGFSAILADTDDKYLSRKYEGVETPAERNTYLTKLVKKIGEKIGYPQLAQEIKTLLLQQIRVSNISSIALTAQKIRLDDGSERKVNKRFVEMVELLDNVTDAASFSAALSGIAQLGKAGMSSKTAKLHFGAKDNINLYNLMKSTAETINTEFLAPGDSYSSTHAA